MALGQILAGVPNSVKIGSGGSTIPNCKAFNSSQQAPVYDTVVDDLTWALNGGRTPGSKVTGSISFLVGGAVSSNQYVTGFAVGATLSDDLIVAKAAKGVSGGASMTATFSNVLITDLSESPDGDRTLVTYSWSAYSSDGSTAPFDLAFA